MTSIYLSASTQPGNRYAVDGTNEMAVMHRLQGILAPKLRALGLTVYESPFKREGEFVSAARDSNAKKADLHLALHSDAGSATRYGSHTIYFPSSVKGKAFARAIQNRMEAVTPWPDFGIVGRTNLYELKATNAVAALVEVSFHDKAKSARWIIDNLELIATALASGVADYLGLKPAAQAKISAGVSASAVIPPKEEPIVNDVLAALAALDKKITYVQAQCKTLGEQLNYHREQNKTLAREHAAIASQVEAVRNLLEEDDLK